MADALLAIVLQLTAAMVQKQEATLLFAGDAMMHQAQIDAARQTGGSYDFTECFTAMEPMIQSADYAVVNLETPLGASNFTGYPCFCAPVSYATALRDAGFDLFLTANNHTLDRRDRGLRYTISALDSLGVPHIGTYGNSLERESALPMVVDVNGFKIGFLNYTYGTNGITVTGDAVVDYIDHETIAADVARARHAGAELVIANMHWGTEYVLSPVASQKRDADFLVSQGVDLVIGSHPHVVEPIEMRTSPQTGRNVPVVYSLGNFISNMRTRDTRGGAVAAVKLQRDDVGNPVVADVHYEYVFTVPPGSGHRNFRVMPVDSVPGEWRSHASAFRKALK